MTQRDPVCKMDIDPGKSAAQHEYAGDTYYFCSSGCKDKFVADPEKYVSRDESSQS